MLDALAIASITNGLDKGAIPAVSASTEKDLRRLGGLNGLREIVDGDSREDVEDASVHKALELGLGAPGLLHRRLAKFRVQRMQRSRGTDIELNRQCEGCRRRRAVAESGSAGSSSQ
jgi:hypothetical protein